LLSAVPIPDPELEKAKEIELLEGDLPSPINPPSGCVFRTRCPVAEPSCAENRPRLMDVGNQHFAACPKA
ncbi:oligopeptide ABC transporter ATP-binding protein OppF, partial [Pseudoalteromonas sp. S4492]|uniref:oligopeptide/dipeptide ABC transporter ATP-binding protein n=1 Tax=Pseudoalteromonas sp. S4492 TaxID=579560 RepID=UPI001286D6F2